MSREPFTSDSVAPPSASYKIFQHLDFAEDDGDNNDEESEGVQFKRILEEDKETIEPKLDDDPCSAYIYEVQVSVWYGREYSILELYVPKLGCSFNNEAGYLQERGNVINSCRGWQFIKKIALSKGQFNTLQSWRDIEFNYRKEVSVARERALNTCFDSFSDGNIRRRHRRDIEDESRVKLDLVFESMWVGRRKDNSLKTAARERDIFYRYAGLRSKDFVVKLLVDSDKKMYLSAIKIERNVRILYRRWKSEN